MGNRLGKKMLQQLKFSSAEKNVQISSTLSNWELDSLILQKTQELKEVELGKIQHCYPIISEIMCDMRFLLDKRRHAA